MIGNKRSESRLQNYETGGPTPDANRRATGGKGVSSAPGRKKKTDVLANVRTTSGSSSCDGSYASVSYACVLPSCDAFFSCHRAYRLPISVSKTLFAISRIPDFPFLSNFILHRDRTPDTRRTVPRPIYRPSADGSAPARIWPSPITPRRDSRRYTGPSMPRHHRRCFP